MRTFQKERGIKSELEINKANSSLQLIAQSAGALWVPSVAFGHSGGN